MKVVGILLYLLYTLMTQNITLHNFKEMDILKETVRFKLLL